MQLWSPSTQLGLNNKRLWGVLLFLAVIVFCTVFTIRARMWTWTAEILPPSAPKMISDTGVQMQAASQNAPPPKMATNIVGPITNKFPHLTRMCNNVSVQMVKGNWVMRDYSQSERKEVQIFINRTREKQGVPATYERPDQKCGNVSYGPLLKIRSDLKWKRALCNPLGTKPYCYENKCAAKSIEECRCPQCYDLRQEIQAELANWAPSDHSCKVILKRHPYGKTGQAKQILAMMSELKGKPNSLIVFGLGIHDMFKFDAVKKANGASRLTTYKYTNCGNPQTDIADLSKLVFGPDPIALPGDITVEFDLALSHTLHSPLMTTVDLRKKTGDTWVKIPCVADIGSCTYSDLCQFLALIPACPKPFIDNGIPCQCPLAQGKYSLPQTSFEVDIAIFPSGDYHGIVNITSNNEHIGCADLMFSFS